MELTLSQERISNHTIFDETLRRRLDAIFPHCGGDMEPVGEIHDPEEALDPPATHSPGSLAGAPLRHPPAVPPRDAHRLVLTRHVVIGADAPHLHPPP